MGLLQGDADPYDRFTGESQSSRSALRPYVPTTLLGTQGYTNSTILSDRAYARLAVLQGATFVSFSHSHHHLHPTTVRPLHLLVQLYGYNICPSTAPVRVLTVGRSTMPLRPSSSVTRNASAQPLRVPAIRDDYANAGFPVAMSVTPHRRVAQHTPTRGNNNDDARGHGDMHTLVTIPASTTVTVLARIQRQRPGINDAFKEDDSMARPCLPMKGEDVGMHHCRALLRHQCHVPHGTWRP